MDWTESIRLAEVIGTIFYTALGIGMMLVCWFLITRFAPFPVVKEIEQDQNVALAVLIGSVFVALALIISAVILSS